MSKQLELSTQTGNHWKIQRQEKLNARKIISDGLFGWQDKVGVENSLADFSCSFRSVITLLFRFLFCFVFFLNFPVVYAKQEN